MACEKGYVPVVQKLIEAEADINLCDQVYTAVHVMKRIAAIWTCTLALFHNIYSTSPFRFAFAEILLAS